MDSVFELLRDNDDKWDAYQMFFDVDYNKETFEGRRTRGIFVLGAPLNLKGKRYETEIQDSQEQMDLVSDYQNYLQGKIESRFETGDFNIVVFSAARRFAAFTKRMFADMAYAMFSILFVWAFICYHTKSLFLGSMGMFLILMSFPITGIIFGMVAQISYFAVLQLMVIFIILGIAADDIFVVVDAWNQSAIYPELKGKDIMETRVKRMSYTFRRSAFAIAVTSSTTSVAFLANLNSKLMPIQAFGAFAGIIVLVNYGLFVLYFPSMLMFWD